MSRCIRPPKCLPDDDQRCNRTRANFDQLLCCEFDVVFEVNAAIADNSIRVAALDISEVDDLGSF